MAGTAWVIIAWQLQHIHHIKRILYHLSLIYLEISFPLKCLLCYSLHAAYRLLAVFLDLHYQNSQDNLWLVVNQ